MATRKLYVGLSEQDVTDLAELRRLFNAAHGTPVKSDADLVRTLIREELAALRKSGMTNTLTVRFEDADREVDADGARV